MPLREYLLQRKFDAQISIEGKIAGTVAEYECREAAVYVHVSWQAWISEMDAWDRACAVAHYRSSLSLRAHVEDAAERAAKRQRGRAARRRGRSTPGVVQSTE